MQPTPRHRTPTLSAPWQDYANWHLGLTEGATDETKARYAFVFGDLRRLHRTGLIACVYRASEWRHNDVELAAHELLQHLTPTAGSARPPNCARAAATTSCNDPGHGGDHPGVRRRPRRDLAMRTFVAAPRAGGPHPRILFSPTSSNSPNRPALVRPAAGYGFLVAAPEIYHRIEPPGTVLGFDDEGKARGQRMRCHPARGLDADTTAGLGWLKHRPAGRRSVPPATAPVAISRSAGFDQRVRATACWYPTGLHDGSSPPSRTVRFARPRR